MISLAVLVSCISTYINQSLWKKVRITQILHPRIPVPRNCIWMTLKTVFLSLPFALVENGHQQFLWAHTELPAPYKAVSYFGECKQEKAADSHIHDRVLS